MYNLIQTFMETIIDFLSKNKEWLFSGLGASVLIGVASILKKKQDSEKKQTQTVSQNVTVNVTGKEDIPTKSIDFKSIDKESISILFIDDQTFDYINHLKNAGYINVRKIRNVRQIDCPEIINANVIFVDVNGVGTNLFPTEQGLGVAKAIKNRFGNAKKVYLYSASHQPLSSDFNILDGVMSKNADPYEFINLIENIRHSKQ